MRTTWVRILSCTHFYTSREGLVITISMVELAPSIDSGPFLSWACGGRCAFPPTLFADDFRLCMMDIDKSHQLLQVSGCFLSC